jgi:hypothetical protein
MPTVLVLSSALRMVMVAIIIVQEMYGRNFLEMGFLLKLPSLLTGQHCTTT